MNWVKVGIQDGVAVILLNRPEKRNALHEPLRRELTKVLDRLGRDAGVRAAVLCGAGEEAFAAGADIGEFAARTPLEQRRVYEARRVYDAVADFPKPLISAIHGFCVGGGNELALASDIRVADATARFGQFEIRVGLIPGAGGTQRLARLVGSGQAMRLGLTGDLIDAREAHRIGLVEFLTEEGKHVQMAKRIAGRMARWSPAGLRRVKAAVKAASELPLSEGLAREKELFLEAFESKDGREGVAAFMEKRRPVFTEE